MRGARTLQLYQDCKFSEFRVIVVVPFRWHLYTLGGCLRAQADLQQLGRFWHTIPVTFLRANL
jgi:hypothetical protein